MKTAVKKITGILSAAILSFGFVALSCKVHRGSANVAFAESVDPVSVKIPEDSLNMTLALQNTFRAISSQVLPAVVQVDVTEVTKVKQYNPFKDMDLPFLFGNPFGDEDGEEREYTQSGLGTGVIVRQIGNKAYVLTNNHVAGKATTIKIRLSDDREFDGTLVGKDERVDIALVSFEVTDGEKLTVAKLGDSSEVQQGDIVLALGSPLGLTSSITQGIISATGRDGSKIGSISDFIQTDAAINQGNSGGPLVNIYGEIIGINTWIMSQSGGNQGLGFSIPINNIKSSIDQFIESGKIVYGWLGVSLVEVEESYKKDLGVEGKNGAFASEIFLNSPAIKGGIRAGDFITALNGHEIKNVNQLVREVGSLSVGTKAKFTLYRGKEKLEVEVTIEERKEDVSGDNTKLWPGFIASPLNDEIKKALKIEDENLKGIVVAKVQEKSPASALRIQNNDVITAVNDKKITSLAEFYAELAKCDSEVWFDIYSEGHTISTGRYKLNK
ncbi:Do family serine endopeptidase [Treponema rectale]|uniref:Do family serine endopeptidase n=1 Tax=Treponema rectale TaxID=744512 RepID=A0A840SD61_9SPIR|nr:Do family serine endopeptidase [Treponema rectale]MBB5217866.1 Do/DeqQ family serine protease [Treponema rectale]QOS40410.1 Do family serine endopeptidase [Treponema rectale]